MVLAAWTAALGGACTLHYSASAAWNPPRAVVVAREPPAPPLVETAPPLPYEGAVWIQGHYDWGGDGWVWLPGTYVRPRAGHQWVSPRYERDGGRVRYVPGYWMPEQAAGTPLAVPPQPVPPQPVPPAPPPPTIVL